MKMNDEWMVLNSQDSEYPSHACFSCCTQDSPQSYGNFMPIIIASSIARSRGTCPICGEHAELHNVWDHGFPEFLIWTG
jgi:hypothetical protein